MKLRPILKALPLLTLSAWGGELRADLSTPKTHRSGAITFNYPKTWKITEDSVAPELHYLFVETPGDALVIFQSYPIDEADNLTAFSKGFSKRAATETPVGKIVDSKFTAAPETRGYEWIVERFNIKLLGESVPHRRVYGTKKIGDRQVFLILQVATEDYARAEPGFELIQKSLHSLKKAEQISEGKSQPEKEN